MASTGSQDDSAYRYTTIIRKQGHYQKHGSRHHLSASTGIQVVMVMAFFLVSSSSAARFSSRPLLRDQNRTATTVDFDQNYDITWGNQLVKFLDNRRSVELRMDQSSGSGFASKNKYLFGYFSTRIKLVPGDSSGTVTAFYLSTQQTSKHDEVDFEFLGNKPGKPHYLSTNVFVNGVGNRESRIRLWFDPTADFHTYSLLWNRHQILIMVSGVVVRVFKNSETSLGVPYPSSKPMQVIASLWNGENWATDGGKSKINWKQSPFIATFEGFDIEGHKCEGDSESSPFCPSSPSSEWWEESGSKGLSAEQMRQLRWVRRNYMDYDYCTDKTRFPKPPPECALNTI